MKSGQMRQTIIFTKVVKWAIQIKRNAIWPNLGPLPLVLFDDIALQSPPFPGCNVTFKCSKQAKITKWENEIKSRDTLDDLCLGIFGFRVLFSGPEKKCKNEIPAVDWLFLK
jgi:hypothetical protein